MQKTGQSSAGVGKKVNVPERTSLGKRQWARPVIRKLQVDQTEAGIGAPDDGFDFS